MQGRLHALSSSFSMVLSSSASLKGDFASSLVTSPGRRARITTPGRRVFEVLTMALPKLVKKAKKVVGIVRVALEAGKATPTPPVRPALGIKGVNIMAFCKEYNAKTTNKPDYVIPVEILVFDAIDVLKFLRLDYEQGQKRDQTIHKKVKVGIVIVDQVRAIAQKKLQYLNCTSIESAMRIIVGTVANI